MRQVTIFLVLVLLMVTASTSVFAGEATGVKADIPKVMQVTKPDQRPVLTAEPGESPIIKAPLNKVISMEQSKPIPMTLNVPTTFGVGAMGGLSGNYDIPGDFPFNTIENAVGILNYFGADDDVTFTLLNATYVENTITFSYNGTKNLTIQPATGVAVTIQFVSTVDNGKGLSFNGAKNITIDGGADGITLEYSGTSVFPTNDAFGATIYMTGATENILVKNTHIKGIVNNAVWADHTDGRPAIFFWNADADPAWADGITFDAITVTNASTGLKALCEGLNFSVSNLTLKNSSFGGAYGDPLGRAFIMEWAYYVTFENNVFDGIDYPLSYYDDGLYTEYDLSAFYSAYNHYWNGFYNSLLGLDASVFKHNIFQNFQSTGASGNGYYAMGMRVYPYNLGIGTSVTFYNNKFLGGWFTNNRVAQFYGDSNPRLYHNTFRLTGTQTYSGQNRRCVYNAGISYNNIVSNETNAFSGGFSAPIHGFFPVGTINNNAIYVPQGTVLNGLTPNQAVAAGYNANGVFGVTNLNADLTITTGPSSAENVGRALVPVLTDWIDANVDTTVLGTRDAGVYQFSTGVPIGIDVFPARFIIPPAGIPVGPPQYPSVIVKNNSASTTSAFNVTVTQTAGAGSYTNTKSVTLSPMQADTIEFDVWTPPSAGSYTFSATTALAGDIDLGNDLITSTTTATSPITLTGNTTYTWDASDEGWSRVIDWQRSNTFTKLGGPKAGYSMVTICPGTGLGEQYTEGAYASSQGYATTYPGANLLTSPWLDISALGGSKIFIALDHSIKLEPDWDRSWLEYTTDGLTWHHLGKLNDPKGINIYNESVYEFAHSDDADGNIDDATLIQYGLIPNVGALPIDTWASNGGATATGPFGWVFAQLEIDAGDYTPEIVGSSAIRFRYVAFSDAATSEIPGGWAVDNFYIGNVGASFIGGTISGAVFHDANGNGVNDAEAAEVGLTVNLLYFGVPKGTTTTGVGGTYTFNTATLNNGLPGVYNVQVVKPGYAFTLPYGTSGIADINHPGTGEILTQNFGTFQGSISGVKFSDTDDDGSNFEAGDALLGGWTIELHQDSANGTLIGSAVTDGDGEYTLLAPPYATYVVTEVAQPLSGRQKFPLSGSHSVAISNISGDPTAIITGINFGNFIFGKWTIEVTVDRNGNGIREAADFVPLPFGMDLDFEVSINSVKDTISLGSGNSLSLSNQLDVGEYMVKRITPIPTGWIQTTHVDSVVFDIATSGFNDTTNFLYFKLLTVSGVKFDDTNGNGTKDGVEPGLEGWIITVSGDGGGVDTTDINGDYLLAGVGPGVHNVTETAQMGWAATSGPFNFTAASADLPVNNKVFNFGNFKMICVSGVKFRDRNSNGVKDAGEEGLAGWTINMTGQTPVVTGVDGSYEFCGIGAGAYTLTEDAQTGWLLTLPVGGQYDIVGVSGVDIIDLDFGNFNEADTAMYRTFTYAQLAADIKKNKTPKVGKPILGPPNMANLMEQLDYEGWTPMVGLENVTNPVSGKIKSYLHPKSYKDAIKTFAYKGQLHTGTAKGFDVDIKGKLMLKRWKSMPPKKVNNALIGELLALEVNMWSSLEGNTPPGFTTLLYSWPGILNGLTIDEIADYADEIMTNWEFIPKENYDSLYAAVKRINEAFSNTVVTDTVYGWFPRLTSKPYSKSTWAAYKTVYEVEFLQANPGVAPRVRPQSSPEAMPVVYELGQNYPNPFNPTTTVEFSLPVDAFVTLKVYNLLGQEVATLIDHEAYFSGEDYVDFDASQLASGVYLYRIVAESISDDDVTTGEVFTQVKKMVLMK